MYKKNSCVIFPREQTEEKESILEVLRMEIHNQHKEWLATNCNLLKEELEGLKSLKLRIKNWELVVLPTDKSGRFAVMTMPTYMMAGEVHIEVDEKVGMDKFSDHLPSLGDVHLWFLV